MYLITDFIGAGPIACAGRNLALTFDHVGSQVRLINRQMDKIIEPSQFCASRQRVAELCWADAPREDTLIVHGSVVTFASIDAGDLPKYSVAVLCQSPAPLNVWHAKQLLRFTQVWSADADLCTRIKELDPRVDIRFVPLPFDPADFELEDCDEKHGYYSFSNNVVPILRWVLSQQEKAELALVPYARNRITTKEFQTVVKETGCKVVDLMSSMLTSNDDYRCQLHRNLQYYLSMPDDHPYFEAEAAAAGSKFSRLEHGSILVNGTPQWAHAPMAEAGKLMLEHIADLRPMACSPQARSSMRVGYVIPHCNRGPQWVRAVLKALTPSLYPDDRVVIADLGSDADTRYEIMDVVNGLGPQVQAAFSAGEWNLSRARNIGAQQILGVMTHFCFLDVDVLVPNDFGAQLRAAMTGATALVLQVGNHEEFLAAEQLPCDTWPSKPQYVRPGPGNVVVPADVFLAIRGFDEAFNGCGSEDIEMLYRLRAEGVTVREFFEVGPAYHQPHAQPENASEEKQRNLEQLMESCVDSDREVNPKGWGIVAFAPAGNPQLEMEGSR